MYSFSIPNESSLISWDFAVDSKITSHVLDATGNVYEVDGNYGSLTRKFSNQITGITAVNSNSCISLKHTTFVTWTGNKVYS